MILWIEIKKWIEKDVIEEEILKKIKEEKRIGIIERMILVEEGVNKWIEGRLFWIFRGKRSREIKEIGGREDWRRRLRIEISDKRKRIREGEELRFKEIVKINEIVGNGVFRRMIFRDEMINGEDIGEIINGRRGGIGGFIGRRRRRRWGRRRWRRIIEKMRIEEIVKFNVEKCERIFRRMIFSDELFNSKRNWRRGKGNRGRKNDERGKGNRCDG